MTKFATLYAAALSALLVQHQLALASSFSSPTFRPQRLQQQQLAFVSHQLCVRSANNHLLCSAAIDDIPSDIVTAEVAGEDGDPESILQSRNKLVALSKTLADNSPSGKFITRPSDKVKLQKAINDLEAMAGDSAGGERAKEMLLGDWTLVATANLPSSDIRRRFNNKKDDNNKKKNGWFTKKERRSGLSESSNNDNPIQKSIRKTITVTQRIRNIDENNGGDIDRVDNVIEYTPLDTLEDIVPESSPLYNLVSNVNVNPLQVKKSKVVLVHKANVESVEPVLRTKIAWVSSVLNVAGTSQYFDPDGADVFGVNNLFGDFINVGTFDTPYVDEDIRISRTSGPVLEQLRVFVREGSSLLEDSSGLLGSLTAEMRVEEDRAVKESERSDLGNQVKKVVEATASMAENARSTIEKDMDDVNKALSDTMDDVTAKVQDAVENDLEEIGKAVEGVQSAIQDGDDIYNVGEALTNVTKAVAKVPGDVQKIVEEDVSELADEVEDVLENMVADVQDSVESDLKDIGDAIDDIRDSAAATASTEEEKSEGTTKDDEKDEE